MKQIVSYEAHREHDESIEGCVVGCFDPRFKHALSVACQTKLGVHIEETDLISIGGGIARNAESENASCVTTCSNRRWRSGKTPSSAKDTPYESRGLWRAWGISTFQQ